MIFVTFEFCGILILNYQFKLSSNGTPASDTHFDSKWSFWFLE